MTDRGLFLRRGDVLVQLASTPFLSEDVLQKLLAENPALLASSSRARPMILIGREIGVPDAEGGTDRWSIDHVFIDSDAVPVIVEVKRATDTRLRREVVAQMLDYAAHIETYWPPERLRAGLAARAELEGATPDELLAGELGVEDADAFWAQVAANFSAGRIRLVFLADSIPRELLRVVEFLNARMSPTEVVAIELQQFAAGDEQVVIPRLLGESVAATDRKQPSSASSNSWTVEAVRSALDRLPEKVARAGRSIVDWFEAHDSRSFGGSGAHPSITYWTGSKTEPRLSVSIFTEGENETDTVTVNWAWMARYVPPERLAPLADELRTIPGVAERLSGLEGANFRRRPGIRLVGILDRDGAMEAFVEALGRFDAATL